MNRIKRILNPAVRRWMYGVTAACLVAAAWFGLVPDGSLVVLVPLAAAFFNVPKSGGADAADD